MITFIGMMVAAGTDVSGTTASTVSIPKAESVDIILVASVSAGSLKTTEGVFTCKSVLLMSSNETYNHYNIFSECILEITVKNASLLLHSWFTSCCLE